MTGTITELIRQSGVKVGLAAHNLETGEEIFIEPDASFHPASTIKTCVMMEAFRQARRGLFSLDDRMVVKNEFASIAGASLYSLSAGDDSETDLYDRVGQSLSVNELISRMITVSSNLATNLLIERVTPQATTRFMQELGTNDVIVRRGVEDNEAFRLGMNNAATARGLMQILLKLARREVVTKQDSDAMIDIMLRQKFNEMMPAQLPPDVRVAHKTGWTGSYYHDVGIVYRPDGKAFVLVILTNGFDREREANSFIAQLARDVYREWVK